MIINNTMEVFEKQGKLGIRDLKSGYVIVPNIYDSIRNCENGIIASIHDTFDEYYDTVTLNICRNYVVSLVA